MYSTRQLSRFHANLVLVTYSITRPVGRRDVNYVIGYLEVLTGLLSSLLWLSILIPLLTLHVLLSLLRIICGDLIRESLFCLICVIAVTSYMSGTLANTRSVV